LAAKNLTDHRVGMNVRAQVPQLHHAVIYGEGVFEELGKEEFWPQFTDWMGFLSGVYFPLLTSDGSDDLRIEYEHIPATYGRHFMWTSGLTEDDVLRGSELGPNGHGIHTTWGHLFPSGMRWDSSVHYENRDSDLFAQEIFPSGGRNRVLLVKVKDNPSETRFRMTASLEWRTREKFVVHPEFGYERVWSFDFKPGSDRNNFLATISLRWYPGFK
jgi:hypothetical protein